MVLKSRQVSVVEWFSLLAISLYCVTLAILHVIK